MSDVMLIGVLRMPPELWDNSPIDVLQRHSGYTQAAERIESDERELTRLRAENERLRKDVDLRVQFEQFVIGEGAWERFRDLEKDARRYRWLSRFAHCARYVEHAEIPATNENIVKDFTRWSFSGPLASALNGDTLDAAIDAAMGGEGEG